MATDIVISSKPDALAKFFEDYMFSDEYFVKQQAKGLLMYIIYHHLDAFVLRLTKTLLNPKDEFDEWEETTVRGYGLASLSIDFLAIIFTGKKYKLWPRIGVSVREELKSLFIQCLQHEESEGNLEKLTDVIVDIANDNMGEAWQQVIDFILQCFDAKVTKGFLLFSKLNPRVVPEDKLDTTLRSLNEKILEVFRRDPVELTVIRAALSLLTKWTIRIDHSTTPTDQSLRHLCLEKLDLLSQQRQYLSGDELESLIEMICETIEHMEYDEATKRLAMRYVICLAEDELKGQELLLEHPNLIKKLIRVILIVAEDDPSWHGSSDKKMETAYNPEGKLYLERMVKALGCKAHEQIMPILIEAGFSSSRILAHAAIAISQLINNCSILEVYRHDIVDKMIICLEIGKPMLKDVALRVLGTVATLSKDKFREYYSKVMPYLRHILTKNKQESSSSFTATLECITVIWVAVGKEKIYSCDIDMVVGVLLSSNVTESSKKYVLQAWGRLCKCLGQDFRPYLTSAIPILMTSANRQSRILTDADKEGVRDVTIRGVKVRFEISVLEEKAVACSAIRECIIGLKEHIYLWIDMVADALIPLLCFEYEDIQMTVFSGISALFISCKDAMDKGYIQGRRERFSKRRFESPVENLCSKVMKGLTATTSKGIPFEIGTRIFGLSRECMEMGGPSLEKEEAKAYLAWMIDFIISISAADVPRNKEIGDSLALFFVSYESIMPESFDELWNCIQLVWSKDATACQRGLSLILLREFMKACQHEASKCCAVCLPPLISACQDKNSEVTNVAALAIGVCVELTEFISSAQLAEAVSGLRHVSEHPDVTKQEHVMVAHHHAVSALGKIIQFHYSRINATEVLQAWLSYLPLICHQNEAIVVHEQLCSVVEVLDKHQLFNQHMADISTIIAVYAKIIWHGTRLATEQTINDMVNQLQHIRTWLPAADWTEILLTLEVHLRMTIDSNV